MKALPNLSLPIIIKTERHEAPTNFRTRYKNHLRVQHTFKQPSLTKQSFKDEHDINNIVRKSFKDASSILHLIKSDPTYGDFSEVTDYHDAMNVVTRAQEQFEALSAPVRERFHNNPSEFLEFAKNPSNGPEMVKLGLAIPVHIPAPPEPTSKKSEHIKKGDKPNPKENSDE